MWKVAILSLSLALASVAQAADKPAGPASITENIKQLVREVTDPSALPRIKAQEQKLEKKIQHKRASQRKDHETPRPEDAVDLVKSLDQPDEAASTSPPTKK